MAKRYRLRREWIPDRLGLLQMLVDELDGHRPLADGRRHPLDRPGLDVSGRDHPRPAGL